MSKQTENSLFISSSLTAFYKQFLSGIADYQKLANLILKEIRAAHAFRQVKQVKELSQLLLSYPIKEYRLIAQYYIVWCGCREKSYHAEILERVVDQSRTYKAQALISRGALEFYKGNFEQALYFYSESLKAQPTASEYVLAIKAIAVIKSLEGFHASALKDIEKIIWIIQYCEPFVYYDALNSYAVELAENNKLSEAYKVSSLAVASPFGPYYKEWQDTFSEVNRKLHKNRSRISVTKSLERESEPQAASANAAKVLPFRPQAPVEAEEFAPFHTLEPKSEFNKVFQFDTRELEATICNWMNGDISPEEFASVLSSLKNLKDPARIRDILDRMIHYAFLQTSQAREAEQAWRNSLYVEIPPDDKD